MGVKAPQRKPSPLHSGRKQGPGGPLLWQALPRTETAAGKSAVGGALPPPPPGLILGAARRRAGLSTCDPCPGAALGHLLPQLLEAGRSTAPQGHLMALHSGESPGEALGPASPPSSQRQSLWGGTRQAAAWEGGPEAGPVGGASPLPRWAARSLGDPGGREGPPGLRPPHLPKTSQEGMLREVQAFTPGPVAPDKCQPAAAACLPDRGGGGSLHPGVGGASVRSRGFHLRLWLGQGGRGERKMATRDHHLSPEAKSPKPTGFKKTSCLSGRGAGEVTQA